MSYLDSDNIRNILDLKGSPLIHRSIAERQLEVIRKGFNYLYQHENTALYLADEVGLGKTYIALGIASLLRHFSDKPETYQDVIVVPKFNLQVKWEKEIRQFISKNYRVKDNIVKSVIGTPVGDISLKNRLEPVTNDIPSYHIYRNSLFSLGLNEGRKELKEELKRNLVLDNTADILERAYELGYFKVGMRSALKKLYAYLLSVCLPPIEMLIVDEGHNFKHGMGSDDGDDVADRNNVITRFLGLRKNSEDDKIIFNDFPELKDWIIPKVNKLMVLSATPKTVNLLELRNQFECFLPIHVLSDAKTEEDVKEKMNRFLIRGKMQYEIGGNLYTRNRCRFEHTSGNTDKAENAAPLMIKGDEQAMVLGLLQYNTIKHLNANNNAAFEIGMLAGFETFRIDHDKSSDDEKEYEEVRTRKMRKSQDYDVLRRIIDSYRDRFGVLPPHPKQDAVVDSVFEMVKRREKALIFVRRVASAYELERRLLDRWEKEIIYRELVNIWKWRKKSDELNQLLEQYEEYDRNRLLDEKIDSLFIEIIQRLLSDKKSYPFDFFSEGVDESKDLQSILRVGLLHLYNNYNHIEGGVDFRDYLIKQMNLKTFQSALIQNSYNLLKDNMKRWIGYVKTDYEAEIEMDEEEDESYFFHKYFNRPHIKSFRKSKIYNADWFDLNYFIINKHFKIAAFRSENLTINNIHAKSVSELKEVQETFLKYIMEEEYKDEMLSETDYPASLISKTTLVTELLTRVCEKEFSDFIHSLRTERKSDIFHEIKVLVTILKSTLRNGSGFLPLFIAAHAEGNIIDNYFDIVSDEQSVFNDVLKEIKTIIRDYKLIRAVNFPEGESQKQIESKLIFQTPVKGITGENKNRNKVAVQFRMPGFPYVLVTTDIFREGEDLHTYCQNIYHYGIAWNCSDMEQRTGRIDRINSLSHRRLTASDAIRFDDQLHVFYPYIRKTLEVNQVYKLFRSINNFIRSFDIIESIKDDGLASISESIKDEITIGRESLVCSRFDHDRFRGNDESGLILSARGLLGMSAEELLDFLVNLSCQVALEGEFYLKPMVIKEEFKIIGDYKLNNRRGPFRVLIKNDIVPGKFIIEASSYLFKISMKRIKALRHHTTDENFHYNLIDIDDYHAISFECKMNDFDKDRFINELNRLVTEGDRLEFQITGEDSNVFG